MKKLSFYSILLNSCKAVEPQLQLYIFLLHFVLITLFSVLDDTDQRT